MSDHLYIGADVGGSAVKFVVDDGGGRAGLEGEIATDAGDAEATLRSLAESVRARLDAPWDRVAGVGLGCAGIVDPDTGRLGRAPNLRGWEGADLVELARTAFADRPVVVAYLILTVFIFVLINLIVDILYSVLDPRIKLEEAK